MSMMFKIDVDPPKMVVEKSKKQPLGEFFFKWREANFH